MDELIDEIRDYHHNHGYYPRVKVSPKFFDQNISTFHRQLYDIEKEIDETVDQWELE